MKFCSQCGTQVMDEAVICIHCGCAIATNGVGIRADDAPSAGFAILGFFIPVVGLILYLTNKDTSPRKADSAGKGALIGFILGLVGIASAALLPALFLL